MLITVQLPKPITTKGSTCEQSCTKTVSMNNFDVSSAMRCYTVAAWKADKVTVNGNLAITGALHAETIAPRITSEVTANGDLVVTGVFLVDTN